MVSNFEYIAKRKLKFLFCPAFSKPIEYWNYLKQEQLHGKSWRIFILLDLIVIVATMVIFFWTNDLTIRIFLGAFSLFCLGDIIKTTFSGSQKMWWVFLFCLVTIFTLAVIWLAMFMDNYLILIIAFFPINHLIALLRSRKFI